MTYKQSTYIHINHKHINNIYCYYVDVNDDEGSKLNFLKNENVIKIVFYLFHQKHVHNDKIQEQSGQIFYN